LQVVNVASAYDRNKQQNHLLSVCVCVCVRARAVTVELVPEVLWRATLSCLWLATANLWSLLVFFVILFAVIVEGAAATLQSHIIMSLTHHCTHLILI